MLYVTKDCVGHLTMVESHRLPPLYHT